MTEDNAAEELPRASAQEKSSSHRSPRTVRFSGSEWQKIEEAACAMAISPAAFTRNAALRAVADREAAPSGVLPPEILELVKRIYRSTYIMSTLKRDEMIHEGRREELDRTVEAAREAESLVLGNASG